MAAVGVKEASKSDNTAVQSVEKSEDGKSVTVKYQGDKDAQYIVMAVAESGVDTSGVPTKEKINNNQDKVVAYMNQATADGEGVVTFDIHPSTEKKGDYGIFVSSTDAVLTQVGEFTLDDLIAMLGDLNGNNGRDLDDILRLVKLVANNAELLEVADLNSNGELDLEDIMMLIKMVANNE